MSNSFKVISIQPDKQFFDTFPLLWESGGVIEAKKTLIEIQESAIADILRAREQGKRAMSYGTTCLNRSARVLRGIRKRFEREATRLGFSSDMIAAQWVDVKDMAILREAASE